MKTRSRAGSAAKVDQALAAPVRTCLLFRPRNRVPSPAQFAGAGVVGAHDAARHIHGAVVGDRRTGDHQIADDRGRGRDFVIAAKLRAVDDAASQIDLAVRSEIAARLAGLAVERDQARVDGALEDAKRQGPAAGGSGRSRRRRRER